MTNPMRAPNRTHARVTQRSHEHRKGGKLAAVVARRSRAAFRNVLTFPHVRKIHGSIRPGARWSRFDNATPGAAKAVLTMEGVNWQAAPEPRNPRPAKVLSYRLSFYRCY